MNILILMGRSNPQGGHLFAGGRLREQAHQLGQNL